jgi:hypothetical protein
MRAEQQAAPPHKPLARFGLLGKGSRTKQKNSMKLHKNAIFWRNFNFFLKSVH